MSLGRHRDLTDAHLRKIEADTEDSLGEARLKAEIREKDPTTEDFLAGRLTPEQQIFICEQTVQNILLTIESDETDGEIELSWQRKESMLRAALSELDRLLTLLGPSMEDHPEKLSLRAKILERLDDMERFKTERHLTGAINGLLDSRATYRRVMEEAWEAALADPSVYGTIADEWESFYAAAENRFMLAVKQERLKKGLPPKLEKEWLSFILSKLDVASSIMTDAVAEKMKSFVAGKLREIEETLSRQEGR